MPSHRSRTPVPGPARALRPAPAVVAMAAALVLLAALRRQRRRRWRAATPTHLRPVTATIHAGQPDVLQAVVDPAVASASAGTEVDVTPLPSGASWGLSGGGLLGGPAALVVDLRPAPTGRGTEVRIRPGPAAPEPAVAQAALRRLSHVVVLGRPVDVADARR